jgi:hypothetical protein
MSKIQSLHRRPVLGTIRRRLLVNALVDPDEAASSLPAGLRPHVTGGGTVVGCCLLDIAHVRPASVPPLIGTELRAAAHRISVEWDDEFGATTVGVYVPVRHTSSRTAAILGGRWFPGVHLRAEVELSDDGRRLSWCVEPRDSASGWGIGVSAAIDSAAASTPCEPIGGTCLSATIGLSPDRRGALEAVGMEPDHRRAQRVEIDRLDSGFLTGFATARPAPSYVIRDVNVTWTRERALNRLARPDARRHRRRRFGEAAVPAQ